MAEKLHKLAALRRLRERQGELEKQHQQRIARGDDSAGVDRDTALAALTGVMRFFEDCGIESMPLIRLLRELTALTAGSNPSAMLAPPVACHRRPDAPSIETVKGRLAAIMEYGQQSGLNRKAAGDWVARHTQLSLKGLLGSPTRATVDSWLLKWGGDSGATPGHGREGYLNMRAILTYQRPTEQKLKEIIKVLAR